MGFGRIERGLWVLVTATLAVVALRFGAEATDSAAPPASTREASPVLSEELRVPAAWHVGKARDFAARRAGRVSFAVVDSTGDLSCYRCRASYHSASVVKAMLLVAYLNRLVGEHKPLTADHETYLDSMIRVSDNNAATAIYAHVGDRRLRALADQAHMTNFHVSGSWGSARITAADQAGFFARLNELTPSEYQGYTRNLLSSIVPRESWGIPEVSRPTWFTMFKGGWLTSRRGSLAHQVARLEKRRVSIAIAILTDGNSTDAHGRATITGIASRLLAD